MAPRIAIAVHGGVGNTPANIDGCVAAAEAGFAKLRAGESSLEGALTAAVSLEDDGRFNAGSGSSLRMDGTTVEMDAAVMDTRGRLGAVAAIQRVKNPVLVARAVTQTPHWLITGGGAIAFARAAGFEDYYNVTERAVQIHRKVMAALLDKTEYDFQDEWRDFDWKLTWNFERRWEEVLKEYGSSTIGSVAMDSEGHFAVCNSTGGSSPMLFGRVGDTPIVGAGYYCGPAGAIAATGIGEYIVKQMLCMTVYRWFETGMPLEDALHKGVRLFPNEIDIGLIAVTKDGPAVADNRQMPTHKMVE